MVLGVVVVVMAIVPVACDIERAGDARPGAGKPDGTTTPEPAQQVSVTEPVELDCDCHAHTVDGDGDGLVAVIDRPPASSDRSTALQVVDGEGTTLWSDDTVAWADLSDSEPSTEHAGTRHAVVARTAPTTLAGLDWSDGSTRWEVPDIPSGLLMESAEEAADILMLYSRNVHEDGTPAEYSQLIALDTAEGVVLWDEQDVDDYAFSPDGEFLVAVDFDADGATLTRVDLGDGEISTVSADSWQGPGSHVNVSSDGLIGAFLGPELAEEVWVSVSDWETDPTATDENRPRDSSSIPDSVRWVGSHEESGLTLATTTDSDDQPETAVMFDADGNELWDSPAEELLSWYEIEDADGYVEVGGTELVELPNGNPVLVVERDTFTLPDFEINGSVDSDAAAYSVYDARRGEELWSWGEQGRYSSYVVPAGQGIFYGVQAGELDQDGGFLDGDTGPSEREPAPTDLTVLDLRTGEPEWEVTGSESVNPNLEDLDGVIVTDLGSGEPMLTSAVIADDES